MMKGAAVVLGLLGAGCGAEAYEGAVPRLEELAVVGPPLVPVDPLAELMLDSLGAVQREIHPLAGDLTRIVEVIDGHRPDIRDGAAQLYGPFDDPDDEALQWLVSATRAHTTTRFELTVGDPVDDAEPVAVGGIADDDGERRAAWTLWPRRRQDAFERDPDIPEARRVEAEVVVDPDGGRVLTLAGEGSDPVGRIYAAGVQVSVDEDGGGSLSMLAVRTMPPQLLSAVPTPVGDGVPGIGVSWTNGGASVIGVLVHTEAGDVLLSACYDEASALTYRRVVPEALAAPEVALGEVEACALPLAVRVPVAP